MSVGMGGIDPLNKEKKSQYKETNKRLSQASGAASASTFLSNLSTLYPEIMKLQEFDRRKAADAAALGERSQLNALGTNMAQRGLSGSGADYYMQQGIRGGRQAALNQANTSAQENALRQALGIAGQEQGMQLQALLGIPIQGKPASGWLNPTGMSSFSASV